MVSAITKSVPGSVVAPQPQAPQSKVRTSVMSMLRNRGTIDGQIDLLTPSPTKGPNVHTSIAKQHPAAKADQDAVDSKSTASPVAHPLFATFKARIDSLFKDFPPSAGFDVTTAAEVIWLGICDSMTNAAPTIAPNATPTAWRPDSKGALRYIDYGSPIYKAAMVQFDKVMVELKKAAAGQFKKGKSFGFWSKPEGRELCEKMCDVTLETSAIGGLFDGLGSLDKVASGDLHLWGALSKAYAEAIFDTWETGRSIHVFAGGGTDKSNIFGQIESVALKAGAASKGKRLEQVTTFHAAAAKRQSDRKVDYSVRGGQVAGTWYSGPEWGLSLTIGKNKFNDLPK